MKNKRFAELCGICWHEIIRRDENTKVCSCGEDYSLFDDYVCGRKNPDFAADPRLVLREMMKREDWLMFIQAVGDVHRFNEKSSDFEWKEMIPVEYMTDTTGLLRDRAIEWMERAGK